MQFLVWREDKPLTSNWPTFVDCPPDTPADEIVRMVFRVHGWPDYEPKNKSYVVVPMNEAMRVRFNVPLPQYITSVEAY